MRFLSGVLRVSRRLGLVIVLLFGTRTGVLTACAQDSDLPPMEKHLALILGNGNYGLHPELQTGPADMPAAGFLKDLANPCRDAMLFRDTLINANWRPEDILFAGCDKTATEMRELINKFSEKVVNSTSTLAIFYYSGHGAQFSDLDTNHSFLFGVGAKIDLVALKDSWIHSPKNTAAIATQAIDLDELITPLGDQPENAIFVILDACRNNPLYGQIDALANAPPIAALGAALYLNGFLVAYSTPHGEFSEDGFGDHSIFTSALVKELRPERPLDNSVNSLRGAVDKEYRKAYPDRTKSQYPVVSGRLNGLMWCLTQCPAPTVRGPAMRSYGNTLRLQQPQTNAEMLKAWSGPHASSFSSRSLPVTASAFLSHASFSTDPRSSSEQMAAAPAQPVMAQSSASVQTIFNKDAGKTDFSVPASAGMHFDVFWCDGGNGSADRERRALDVANALGAKARAPQETFPQALSPGELSVSSSIVSVRLRRLTALANTGSGFRYADDVIVYDRDNAHEVAWSKLVNELGGGGLKLDGGTSKTPNYMSVYMCRVPAQQERPKTLIYLQVPSDSLKPSGHLLLKGLTRAVPTVKDAGGIQTRPDGPDATELRFYNEEERDNVFSTAKVMEQLLKQPVKVQFIPRLASKDTAGHMEIWLGKSEPALNGADLKVFSSKKESKD